MRNSNKILTIEETRLTWNRSLCLTAPLINQGRDVYLFFDLSGLLFTSVVSEQYFGLQTEDLYYVVIKSIDFNDFMIQSNSYNV